MARKPKWSGCGGAQATSSRAATTSAWAWTFWSSTLSLRSLAVLASPAYWRGWTMALAVDGAGLCLPHTCARAHHRWFVGGGGVGWGAGRNLVDEVGGDRGEGEAPGAERLAELPHAFYGEEAGVDPHGRTGSHRLRERVGGGVRGWAFGGGGCGGDLV